MLAELHSSIHRPTIGWRVNTAWFDQPGTDSEQFPYLKGYATSGLRARANLVLQPCVKEAHL